MSSSKKIELLEKQQYELYAKIGKLSSENAWLKKAREIADLLGNPLSLIEENLYFSISEQCRIFGDSRSSYYYAPRSKIDIHTEIKEKIKEHTV